MQHQTPVSDNEPKAPYHYFISLSLSQKKEGSLAHKVYRGEEEIMVWTRLFKKKVSPWREADDKKAKLLKFGQSVF